LKKTRREELPGGGKEFQTAGRPQSIRSQVLEHLAMVRNPAFSEKPGFFLAKNF